MTYIPGGGGGGSIATSSDVALNNAADNDVLTYDSNVQKWTNAPAPAASMSDATATAKGAIQLAGDLNGTADAPTVPGLAGKADIAHTHAIDDLTATGTKDATTFLRGDNTWAVPTGGSTAIATGYLVVAAADSASDIKSGADVVCTGTSGNTDDDAVTINAAANGRPLLLLPGNYYIGTAINLTLHGNQARSAVYSKAIINIRTTNTDGMTCLGSVQSGMATLTTQAVKGSNILSVGPNSIANGDILNIRTTDPFTDETYAGSQYPSGYKGEWVTVVSGGGTTSLTLKRRLFDTYSLTPTAPTLRRITPVTDVRVEGIKFVGAGQSPSSGSQYGLRIQYFNRASVIGCGFYDLATEGVRLRAGLDALIEQCYGERVCSGGTAGSLLKMLGVENGRFINNHGGQDCRHLIDADGYDPDPPSWGIEMIGNVSQDTVVAGIGTHIGVGECLIDGNTVMRGGAGILVRGRGNIVTDNLVIGPFTGTYPGMYMIGDGNDTTKNGAAGLGLVFTGNKAIGNSTSTGVSMVGVHAYKSLDGARISDLYVSGFTEHAVFLRGPHVYDTVIENVTLECSGMKSAKDAIRVEPASPASGRNQRDFSIRRVVLVTPPTGNAVTIVGPTEGTASTNVSIYDNDFRGKAVSITNLVTSPLVQANGGQPTVVEGATPASLHGWVAWSMDAAGLTSGTMLSSGRLETAVMWVPAGTLTGLVLYLTGAGSGLTGAGVALYEPGAGGALLASGDAVTAFGSTGLKEIAFSSSLAWSGGYLRAAWWAAGTTQPTVLRGSGGINLTSANQLYVRFANANTGLTTTTPPTIGTLTATGTQWWVAVQGTQA